MSSPGKIPICPMGVSTVRNSPARPRAQVESSSIPSTRSGETLVTFSSGWPLADNKNPMLAWPASPATVAAPASMTPWLEAMAPRAVISSSRATAWGSVRAWGKRSTGSSAVPRWRRRTKAMVVSTWFASAGVSEASQARWEMINIVTPLDRLGRLFAVSVHHVLQSPIDVPLFVDGDVKP